MYTGSSELSYDTCVAVLCNDLLRHSYNKDCPADTVPGSGTPPTLLLHSRERHSECRNATGNDVCVLIFLFFFSVIIIFLIIYILLIFPL